MAQTRFDPGGTNAPPASAPGPPGGGRPTISIPPAKPKAKGPPSVGVRAEELFKRFPQWRQYWGTIRNAASRWGADPVELLALLIFENTGADPDATSSAGAVGLAQILDGQVRRDLNPAQYESFVREWGELSPERKRDPAYAIQYASWRLAGTRAQYGSLDDWYRSNYNPGFKGDKRGAGPSVYVGTYQPAPPQTPVQAAGGAIDVGKAKTAVTDPWVVVADGKPRFRFTEDPPGNVLQIDGLPVRRSTYLTIQRQQREDPWVVVRKGKPAYVQTPTGAAPPGVLTIDGLPVRRSTYLTVQRQAREDPWVVMRKGKVKYGWTATGQPPEGALIVDGLPVRQSEFARSRRDLEEMFVSYTGKRPNDEQVANVLRKGWSTYTLANVLSKTDAFTKSPVWKSVAAGYQAAAKDLIPPGRSLDPDLIRQAILNRWDGDTFQAKLRERPGYVQSVEFKGKTATFLNVYQQIYGVPDEGGMIAVREATIGGWSLDQFAGWLRSHDAYTASPEFRAKTLAFLDELGMVTGQTPVLAPGPRPQNEPGPVRLGQLPDDPRVAGRGQVTPSSYFLTPTFSKGT